MATEISEHYCFLYLPKPKLLNGIGAFHRVEKTGKDKEDRIVKRPGVENKHRSTVTLPFHIQSVACYHFNMVTDL